LKKKGKRK